MDGQNFTFTPKAPSKTSRRAVPNQQSVAVSGSYFDYLPIVIALGTGAGFYFLYKEFEKSKKQQYTLGQTVKDMQAKLDEAQISHQPHELFPYEDSENDSDDESADESVGESADDSGDEEIEIKQRGN